MGGVEVSGTEWTAARPLRVIELFAGYGSQRMALERLRRGFHGFAYEVVAVSEVDGAALRAYRAVHGDCPNLGDVTRVDWSAAPDCDLMTWSFPCQSVSAAGLRAGLKEGSGTASSLAWAAVRAIGAKRPRWALMENVKALLSDRFAEDFASVRERLSAMGYSNHWACLDASDYGSAQRRERVFMASELGGGPSFHWPRPTGVRHVLADVLEDGPVSEREYMDEAAARRLAALAVACRDGRARP